MDIEEGEDLRTLVQKCFGRNERVILIADNDVFSGGRFVLGQRELVLRGEGRNSLYDLDTITFIAHEGFPIKQLKLRGDIPYLPEGLDPSHITLFELFLKTKLPEMEWRDGSYLEQRFIPQNWGRFRQLKGILRKDPSLKPTDIFSEFPEWVAFFVSERPYFRFPTMRRWSGHLKDRMPMKVLPDTYSGLEVVSADRFRFDRKAVPVVRLSAIFGDPFCIEDVALVGLTPYSAIFQAKDGAIGMLYTKTPILEYEIRKS